jgi:peptide/nickel transport system substrate-binding protein
VTRAKKLLADAGLPNGYAFEMVIVNNPQQRRVGEVIQGMARDAGLNVTLRPQEFASSLNDSDAGKHQAFLIGWSGRVDPDGNVHQGQTCTGPLNATLACDEKVDALLNKAREVTDLNTRRALYREANDLIGARRNIIYLYHPHYIEAHAKSLKGYRAVPDGLMRIKGTSWQ